MRGELKFTGGCLCGAIRYRATGTPFELTHCHCVNCRKASGAAFVSWVSFRADGFKFTKGRPANFKSSARGIRSFCGKCGSQLTFRNPKVPGEVDVTICTLDRPELLAPASHSWWERRVPWLRSSEVLPKHLRDLPKGA